MTSTHINNTERNVPLLATIVVILCILILCALGTWQIQRLHWKQEILKEIDRATVEDRPLTAADFIHAYQQNRLFVRGTISGHYLHDKEIIIGPRTHEGQPGYHLFTPFQTEDQALLFVNRGFVPLDKRASYFHPPGRVTVSGTARQPEHYNPFVPPNQPEQEQWFRIAPEEMANARELKDPLPYVLYAEQESLAKQLEAQTYPILHTHQWRPRNNHLQYAMFWYGMAVVLLMIYYLRFIRRSH